jgi:transposase
MMQNFKAYKYRIYPTKDQEVLFNKTLGYCRVIKKDLPLKDRSQICECGDEISRDLDVAINIKNEAIQFYSIGSYLCLTDAEK